MVLLSIFAERITSYVTKRSTWPSSICALNTVCLASIRDNDTQWEEKPTTVCEYINKQTFQTLTNIIYRNTNMRY
jgi:hypothetical protein